MDLIHTRLGFDPNSTNMSHWAANATHYNYSLLTERTTGTVANITNATTPWTQSPTNASTVSPSSTLNPMFPQLALSAEAWIAFEVMHGVLTALALGANCLSLGVIYGVMHLTPPLQILTSLAFADMLAPWGIMTMYFAASACQEEIHSGLLLLAHNATALSVMAYAICYNIATYRPLHYNRVITQRRVWITVNVIWILAVLTSHMHFMVTLAHRDYQVDYCVQVQSNFSLGLLMAGTICVVTVFLTGCTYIKMFLHLRPLEIIITREDCQPRKSTRGVITGMLMLSSYALSWGPYLILKYLQTHGWPVINLVVLYGINTCHVLILLHAIVDPAIYGTRMTNIYLGYYRLWQRFRGWLVVSWSRLKGDADGDDHPSTPLNPIESIC